MEGHILVQKLPDFIQLNQYARGNSFHDYSLKYYVFK